MVLLRLQTGERADDSSAVGYRQRLPLDYVAADHVTNSPRTDTMPLKG